MLTTSLHWPTCFFGRARNGVTRPTISFLSAHGDAHGVAPLADLRIAHAVDGFVGPLGRRGGKRLRVHIAGRGVVGEQPIAFAIAAIHLDFAHVEEGGIAAPAQPISTRPPLILTMNTGCT